MKESARLRQLADELHAMEARLREIQDEVALTPEGKKLLGKQFLSLHEAAKCKRDLESAAVKIGGVVGMLWGSAKMLASLEEG
jgi:hypothetical protein